VRDAFYKGHGLGNDYLVFDPAELDFRLTPARIRAICDRHTGVGSDGILVQAPSRRAHFGLRIVNPDGSEAEKSGNGLRIFARYLHATRRTRRTRFTIETRGGLVKAALRLDGHGEASAVTVGMGRASFRPAALPCTLDVEELLDRPIRVGGRTLRFTGVSVGNPHCVVFRPAGASWKPRELRELGPPPTSSSPCPWDAARCGCSCGSAERGRRSPPAPPPVRWPVRRCAWVWCEAP
jgi:diaminopimelate epimerase